MFTFSKMSQQVGAAKNPKIVEDLIKKIESCRNFSQEYCGATKPKVDIESGNLVSVVFKTKEDTALQIISYEYWVAERGEATYYTISVSMKDKLLDSIMTENGYTVPSSALKFNEKNELEIVYYGSPRL